LIVVGRSYNINKSAESEIRERKKINTGGAIDRQSGTADGGKYP
jgi:hypothetical protein